MKHYFKKNRFFDIGLILILFVFNIISITSILFIMKFSITMVNMLLFSNRFRIHIFSS